MSLGLEAVAAALEAFRNAGPAERRHMIEAHYARLRQERRNRYEVRHGRGSVERHQAELAASPLPSRLSVAHPREVDRYGFFEWGR